MGTTKWTDLVTFRLFSPPGLYDKCFYASSDRGWLLGIQAVSEQGNRDPRFFFSLKTDRAHKVTSIHSNARYTPNQWAHLAATYDGVYMKLYVNGAQVGVSREQSGDVFSHLTKKCKVLMIGGNALNHNYRGAVERVGLWRQARGQRQIIRDMQGHEDPQELPQLVIRENFRYPDRKWLTVKDGNFPKSEPGINGRLGYAGGVSAAAAAAASTRDSWTPRWNLRRAARRCATTWTSSNTTTTCGISASPRRCGTA